MNDEAHLGEKIIETGLPLYENPNREIHGSPYRLVEQWEYKEPYYRRIILKARRIFFKIEDVEVVEKEGRIGTDKSQLKASEITKKPNVHNAAVVGYQYPKEVISLLKEAKSEINHLYDGMKKNAGGIPKAGEDPTEDPMDSFKEAGLVYLREKAMSFKVIQQKHVDNDDLYYAENQTGIPNPDTFRRSFIGKLCQILISDRYPRILTNPAEAPRGYGIKPLYDLFRKV